jgi:hypothetical protein
VNPALAAIGPRGTAAGIIDVRAGYTETGAISVQPESQLPSKAAASGGSGERPRQAAG